MSGLELSIAESVLAAFLLAVARTAGFVLVAPPFATRSVPAQIRVGVAVVLALPLATFTSPIAPALTSSALLVQMILQVVMGLTMGFLVLVATSTIQAIGDLLDTVGGFQMSLALDPLLLVQTSVLGRLHQMLTATLLFATGGHLLIIQGLARSVQLMPIPALSWDDVARAVEGDVAGLLGGAVLVAAPVMAAMFVSDVALGLLTRAAPALNAFSLGFPLKILFTLLLTGIVITRIPGTLATLVEHAVLGGLHLAGIDAPAAPGTGTGVGTGTGTG